MLDVYDKKKKLFNLKCIGYVRLKCEHMNFYLVKGSLSKFKYK